MSNYLTKPYEITLWKDDPNGAEVKICTIGTNTMEGQNRAFEPIFSRNVNGVKKLSFKIYKKYVDTQTGEEIDNPYMPYLISERKIKLYLPEEPVDNQWHDFIIKNVSENSATHLCTYQLEDALVQELSKNGFGVTLDAKLMNNIGTANELASYILRETDWGVSDNSEAFVQTIDEALVYLKITQAELPQNIKIYKIIGQNELKSGITDELVYEKNEQEILIDNFFKEEETEKTILAFYSSCTGKPHRFQFLYSANGYNTEEELKNYINNETDYQYYIDFENPEDDYSKKIQDFYLPAGFNTTTVGNSVLCTDYRGRRYGFSQQAKYIPALNRYVQLYKKGEQEYYGYEHAEYKSPALTQNMISNSTFESVSGWTGTKKDISGEKAKVEAVYGYFNGNAFINAIDELKNGTFDPETKTYKSFLKLDFDGANSTVINSGPFDNRTLIGNMVAGDEWALWSKVIGPGTLSFTLGEYKYSSTIDGYDDISGEISFSNTIKTETKGNKTYSIYTVESSSSSKESFEKNMNVRLQISAPNPGEYYLEAIELFKVARCDNTIIPLEEQVDSLEDRTVEKTYYYFTDEALKGITSADQLKPEATAKTLSYTTYKPVYNEGAQKVRTVTAKESNYFNILQSIAETFEAWLTFDISRNGDGGIQEKGKKIAFKNYVGGNNYACFRYGVNLKDIQRTFESKNIVTKLIVKNNSNEHADGGFCTIQRASANPTGENYIYDFQYFFNQGLMNDKQYLHTLYVVDGAQGPDNAIWTNGVGNGTLNLQGYFPRIKALNNKIQTESELLANIAQDLTKYKADLAVAEAGLDASTSGIEEVREDFLLLTGVTIDMLSGHTIDSIEVGNKRDSEDEAKENGGWYYTDRDWIGSVSVTPSENKKSIKATVNIIGNASASERSLYIKVYPTISLSKNGNTATLLQYYNIKCTIAANATSGSGSVDIEVVNSSRNDVQKKLQEYAVYVANENKYTPEKITLQSQVDVIEAQYNEKQDYIENNLKEWKRQLNQLFFQTYSRFIQEGTWISEEYVDDGLYYADAQSVMYNSCYPQVAYTINVISVEGLPGYEDFKYKLGEKTWVVDPDFFGDEDRESVIITEIVENLDDRSKNQIKVQNFKNQFQDLFQKITATVQQAQYNTGSYEKAVALAEANQERKQQFLTDALDSASARLTTAGQQSVTWGNDGITVKSVNSPNDAIRMVGGAILLSKQDENGQQKWVTGVTSDGVSASLITAGVLNAGEISIMNYDEPVFRWDSFGISAYDATWYSGGTDIGTVISGVNTKKFVRFDKHGIYGINNAGVDGANWHPQDNNEVDEKSTFALTWEGLKVTGNEGVVARLGKLDNYILKITDAEENSLMSFSNDGILRVGSWSVDPNGFYSQSASVYSLRGRSVKQVIENPPDIFLSPVPRYLELPLEGMDLKDDIIFKAGNNFYVSENGTLYAKSGRIGNMAIEDLLSGNVSSTYSWQFSPEDGIKMWIGPQPNNHMVFSLDINNLYINATQGEIASWEISAYSLGYQDTQNQNNTLRLYGRDSNIAFGETTLGLTAGAPVHRPSGIHYDVSNTVEFTSGVRTAYVDASPPSTITDAPELCELEIKKQSNYTEESLSTPGNTSVQYSFTSSATYYSKNFSVGKQSGSSIAHTQTYPSGTYQGYQAWRNAGYNTDIYVNQTTASLKSSRTFNLQELYGHTCRVKCTCGNTIWDYTAKIPSSYQEYYNLKVYNIASNIGNYPMIFFGCVGGKDTEQNAYLYVIPSFASSDTFIKLWNSENDNEQIGTDLFLSTATTVEISIVDEDDSYIIVPAGQKPRLTYTWRPTNLVQSVTSTFNASPYFSSYVNSNTCTLINTLSAFSRDNCSVVNMAHSINSSEKVFGIATSSVSHNSGVNLYLKINMNAPTVQGLTLTYSGSCTLTSVGDVQLNIYFENTDANKAALILLADGNYPKTIEVVSSGTISFPSSSTNFKISQDTVSLPISATYNDSNITYSFDSSSTALYQKKMTVSLQTGGQWYGRTWAFVLGKDGSITTNKASLGDVDATSIKMWDAGRNKYVTVSINNGTWVIN